MVDYDDYMRSKRWGELRGEVMLRAGWICELPGCDIPAVEVHHITYDRFGNEELTDLAATCLRHHAVLHDLSHIVEPCDAASEMLDPDDGIECYCAECGYRRDRADSDVPLRERLTGLLNAKLYQAVGGRGEPGRFSKLKRAAQTDEGR